MSRSQPHPEHPTDHEKLPQAPGTIIVMGVAGSGKTVLGQRLAHEMRVPFFDGDQFHSEENVAKMRAGVALTDVDRAAWLERTLSAIVSVGNGTSVVACSALRKRYRDVLRTASAEVRFVFLQVSSTLAAERVSQRPSHFMPASLVQSQFDALELPSDEADVLWLDAAEPLETLAGAALKWIVNGSATNLASTKMVNTKSHLLPAKADAVGPHAYPGAPTT